MTDFGRRLAVAAANVLPKTGQTTSLRDGDDGYYEAGWEGDRFTDNEDGTITDNATGLMWPDDANGAGGNNGNAANWYDAIDYAEALTFAGHDDWKLPNIFELISLIDYQPDLPDIYLIIQNAQQKSFWTSTTRMQFTILGWYWWNALNSIYYTQKTNLFNFFCCRQA